MKIRRLNEDAKRFYVDEIVSAPGGKTETERHSFSTLDEMKKYCKDANLTRDDIASCGGCAIKDLCEELEGSLHIQYCPSCGCQNEYSDSQDNGSWVRYTCRSCGNTWDIDKPQTNALKEEVKKLHAQSEALEFLANEFNTALDKEGFDYTIDIVDDYKIYVESDKLDAIDTFATEFFKKYNLTPDVENRGSGHCYMLKKAVANVQEEVEKLHTKPNGEYLVKSDSGKGYTAFSRDNVAIGGIDNEDADSDDKAIDKFKRNEYSECLNEAYFDTAEYRIQKYEDDIPELMAGMHDDYMEGKLDADRYAEVLKKVYDALADCDYKHTMSAPVVRKSPSERMLDRLKELDSKTMNDAARENLDELFDIKVDAKGFGGSGNNVHVGPGSMPLTASVEENEDDETLNEGSEKYYAAKYTAVDNSGNKTVKKICFRCDGTLEDAEKEVDALIKEPYTELKVMGSCLKGAAEKDGYKLIESVDYDGGEDFEYDDDYSEDYSESLDECSGIRAHKVIMGEGIDDIGIDGDLGEEGPTGDKTEDIEFVMEEYIPESLLIDFVEKVDALTYKVGANDQVVTVVFDPKWSEYVYTIDGKGPYSHSSYEFISRDIYDYIISTRNDDYELDDLETID